MLPPSWPWVSLIFRRHEHPADRPERIPANIRRDGGVARMVRLWFTSLD